MVNVILIIILLICLFTDLKYRKIFNIITIPTIIFAVIHNSLIAGYEGFLFSAKGFFVGLIVFLIPYLLGGMGAGDVKLMAAIGALMGTSFVFYSFIYTGLIGGFIAIVLIVKNNGLKNLIKSLIFNVVFFRSNLGSIIFPIGKEKSRILFPYGIAIVLGTLCTLIWGGYK
ncbi:prepilin peptidase [Neobacillus niacini]|uniref:A24 family peptidase n=1 Tax=Neobacillus niacini TaxID=86668 RepID=UPI0021CB6DB0|nr:prepilin peptidase [Neobacillus niacini]MCM3765806.1 prepilin peptidase [Neobacillus niacini]